MRNSQQRALDLFVAGYGAMIVLVGVMIVRGVLVAGAADRDLVRQDARIHAEATAQSLGKEIAGLRHVAGLFVRQEGALLQKIAASRDPESLVFDLADTAVRWFPGALAFTVVDARGQPLVTDFKGNIGPVCYQDMKRAASGELTSAPLHAGGAIPHIDIVMPFAADGARKGSFMVSFGTANLLTSFRLPEGSRHLIDYVAAAAARDDGAFDVPVAGSDLAARSRVSRQYLDEVGRAEWRAIILYVGGFTAFAALGGLILWRARSQILAHADELRRLNDDLHRAARTDPLTGLDNRRVLHERAETVMAQARRECKTVVLALLDLDHFKRLNDQRGHAAGDACLAAVGAIVGESAQRPLDLAVRYGGEEFLLCWYDTGPEQALAQARLIAERLRALSERNADGTPLTTSIGIVVCRADETATFDDRLKQADAALYRAKAAGRDRIEFA